MSASESDGLAFVSRHERLITCSVGALIGIGVVIFFNLVGPFQVKSPPIDGTQVVKFDFSRLVVNWANYRDINGQFVSERNWFSVQAVMWVALFIGLAELWIRRRVLVREKKIKDQGILPDDESTLLTVASVKPIYQKARVFSPSAILPALIRRLAREFNKSQSVEKTKGILDSSLELYHHKLDLGYTIVRYFVWLIPALGFLGTVMGIAEAMGFAGSGAVEADLLLGPTTQKLAVAFYTTWLGLVLTAVLVLGMSLVQAAEERTLNETGEYCLDNFVLRLIEESDLKGRI